MGRIKTEHQHGEVYPNVFSDFEWVRENREQLLAEYGERVILVYEKQVVGVGDTQLEAVENAERNLPTDSPVITPIIEMLYRRHPFWRIVPQDMETPSS